MRDKKYLFLFLLGIFSITVIQVVTFSLNTSNQYSPFLRDQSQLVSQSIPIFDVSFDSGTHQNNSSVIRICNNEDFANQSWPGNGTSAQPYLITNLTLSTTSKEINLIEIYNTTEYFSIQECVLHGEADVSGFSYFNYGIFLSNVSNAFISRNIITNLGGAIKAFASTNITIESNRIENNWYDGIHIDCSFTNQSGIISLDQNSYHHVISDNQITSHNWAGIFASMHTSIIQNNIITDCHSGIKLYSSQNLTVSKNFISNCSDGIYLDDAEAISLHNNWLSSNIFNLNLDCSVAHCYVQNNDFFLKSLWHSYVSQVKDNGLLNVFSHNFWDDYTEPDIDQNGFVDFPYQLPGEAQNEDPFPLTSPNYKSLPYLSKPFFLTPLPETINNGSVFFSWKPSKSSNTSVVVYDLYYTSSADHYFRLGSTNWVLLAQNLATSEYIWEVNQLGYNYGLDFLALVTARSSDGLIADDITGIFHLQSGISTNSTSSVSLPTFNFACVLIILSYVFLLKIPIFRKKEKK